MVLVSEKIEFAHFVSVLFLCVFCNEVLLLLTLFVTINERKVLLGFF